MQNKLRMLEIEQQHLTIVSEFAVTMLCSNAVEQVVWHLARNVVSKLGFDDVVVYLFDQQRQILCQAAAFGNKNPLNNEINQPLEISLGEGVVGSVAQNLEPLRIDDTREYPGYIIDDEQRLSELAVPMVAQGQLIGVIDSEHSQKQFYTQQHERTLSAIASIAATKIVNAQIHVQLQETVKQLEQAKAEAEQASALKSAFVANISHEIRTPLTAIIGFTEQALVSNVSAEQRQDYLTRVLNSGQHLLHLINDILDLSKIEADKLQLSHEPLNLFHLLDDIVSYNSLLAQKKQLTFDLVCDYPLPRHFYGDQVRLRQVLLNLCHNAVRFTTKGQVILKVQYDQLTNQLAFCIEDSGIGMTADEQTQLFKPFVQIDSSNSRQYGGTGLGLVISRKLVRLMNGKLHVDSEKGRGSRFEVVLSLTDQPLTLVDSLPASQAVAAKPTFNQTRFDGAKILVAEDNQDNQLLIKVLLAQMGATVHLVDNGQAAVETALMNNFDLILLDIQMPKMDGCEAVQLLKQGGIDCPIIALTANIMTQDVAKYLAVGFDDTLGKPIEMTAFYSKLSRYLRVDLDSGETDINDSEAFRVISEKFKARIPTLKNQIEQLVHHSDWPNLKYQAHQLKGSAGSMGFPELTYWAGQIEEHLAVEQYELATSAALAFIEQCDQEIDQSEIYSDTLGSSVQ